MYRSVSFEFSTNLVTFDELYNILVKFNVKKATGFDGTPNKILIMGAALLGALISDTLK